MIPKALGLPRPVNEFNISSPKGLNQCQLQPALGMANDYWRKPIRMDWRFCAAGVNMTCGMKALVTISIGCLAIIGLAASVSLWVEVRSNRDLRTAHQKLEKELRATQKTIESLRAENTEVAKRLVQAQETSQSLQTRISETEAAGSKDAESPAAPPVVAPYHVPAYLGRTYLGQAWIIPRNFRLDTNSQRYVYEPVVWLDESFRNRFVVYHTNVVERAVEPTYVNNSYYPQPLYYVTSFGHHRRGRQAAQPPPGAIQQVPKFNPGSGVTTPQQIGTAAGTIKTRPQVLGTPAPPTW